MGSIECTLMYLLCLLYFNQFAYSILAVDQDLIESCCNITSDGLYTPTNYCHGFHLYCDLLVSFLERKAPEVKTCIFAAPSVTDSHVSYPIFMWFLCEVTTDDALWAYYQI